MFEEYNDLITIPEMGEMLQIGKNACYNILSSGEVKAYRYGRRWKIPKQAVVEYIKTKSNLK